MYETLVKVFYKKYNMSDNRNKGIRLLGAALQNLEDVPENGEEPEEIELFDDVKPKNSIRDKKERTLEETIVKINDKFPEAALNKGLSLLRKK
jgi:hypothetical protein